MNKEQKLAQAFRVVAADFIVAALALEGGMPAEALGELGLSSYWIEAQGVVVAQLQQDGEL